MGMSNRAVPDSFRQEHTQQKHWLQDDPDPDVRQFGNQMPNQPSLLDMQYQNAKFNGGVDRQPEKTPMQRFNEMNQGIPAWTNESPHAQNYLQSLRGLLIHQDKPTEFK